MGAQVYRVEAAGASCVSDGDGSKREIEKSRTKCESTIFLNGIKKRTQTQLSGRYETDRSWITAHTKHTSGSCPTAATNNESTNGEPKKNETKRVRRKTVDDVQK